MSSNTAAAEAATISCSLLATSCCAKFALESPAIISSDPWGRYPRAATTLYIVDASLGGEVKSNDVPTPLTYLQLEADKIGSIMLN